MENKQYKYNEIEYWIACSGGLDSTFLVHLFYVMNKRIGILHCNFKLRGEESDGDEHFVRELANKLNIPIQVKILDVNAYKESSKSNTQLAARELRYNWFNTIKSKSNSKIVLGHHLDDQRETFILQLLRGASVNGLAAMPYERDGFIRPLLRYTKDQIRSICQENNWIWREDSSNQQDDYTRNDLRLNLLPKLVGNGLNLQLIDSLIEDYQQLLSYIESNKLQVGKESNQITLKHWKSLPLFYQNAFLEDIGFGKNNIDLVNQLANAHKGAYALRNAVELWNEGDYLLFKKQDEIVLAPKLSVVSVKKDEIDFSSKDLFIDADKVIGSIYLRSWEEGDEFSPLGLLGKKKISDYLKDKKVPSSEKKNQFVAVDEQGIIGVVGFVPSNRVKITTSSKHFFRLSVELSM